MASRIQQRVLADLPQEVAGNAIQPRDGARESAASLLRARGLPDQHSEHWRHANLRALDGVRQLTAVPAGSSLPVPQLPPALPGFERLVIVDGRLAASLGSFRAAATDDKPAAVHSSADQGTDGDTSFALLATVFGGEPTTLDNRAGDAIEVIFVSTGAPGSVYPRLHLRVDASRPLRLVERHLGGTLPDALVCTQIQVELLAGATLDHYRLQDCATSALWFDTVTARLGANSNYQLRQLMAGAATARSTASVQLAGDAARFAWHGVAAIHQRQTADLLVRVVHQAAATRTEQLFRGITADQAHIGFDADVQVQSAAAGARVKQSLRGLIDGKGAAVNLRPRLTIHTDDIQASHGATTGQLDENLLFYLLSRGLEPDTARALLKWAFLGDALAAIDIAPLRREAERAAAGHLPGQMADSIVAGLLA